MKNKPNPDKANIAVLISFDNFKPMSLSDKNTHIIWGTK